MGIFNGNDQWFTSIYEDPKRLLISSNIQQGPSCWIRPIWKICSSKWILSPNRTLKNLGNHRIIFPCILISRQVCRLKFLNLHWRLSDPPWKKNMTTIHGPNILSRELTDPILRKGKSSSNMPFGESEDTLVAWRGSKFKFTWNQSCQGVMKDCYLLPANKHKNTKHNTPHFLLENCCRFWFSQQPCPCRNGVGFLNRSTTFLDLLPSRDTCRNSMLCFSIRPI